MLPVEPVEPALLDAELELPLVPLEALPELPVEVELLPLAPVLLDALLDALLGPPLSALVPVVLLAALLVLEVPVLPAPPG